MSNFKMVRITCAFTLLFIVVAAISPEPIQGSVIPAFGGQYGNKSHLKYIGSFSSSLYIREIIRQQTSYYFLSQNAAGYTTANNDCKDNLGSNADLLSIETKEELAQVTSLLENNDDTALHHFEELRGSSYWLGGRYDVTSSKFVWENGAEIDPLAPWDYGYPDTRTAVTRVFAHTIGGILFRTQFNTVSTRYICELKAVQREKEAEPCNSDNDLAIVVDSSGSIGQTHYMVALEFTTRLAIVWADNPGNRVSVIVYSSNVQNIINLSRNLTVSEIRNLLYAIPYLDGGSATIDVGLNTALQEFQQNPRSVANNLVFLTDGASGNPSATIAAAQRVQAAGIRSFSVGIGFGIVASELLAIAGNNPDHVFIINGNDNLLKLLQPVSRNACNK